VAQRRHPRAGTGSGSWGHSYRPYHGGYYRPHGGYYRPYYGGYYPYHHYSGYYRPWFYGSLYFGWPYYSSWPYYSTWPYYGGGYSTSSYVYSPSYYSSYDAPAPYLYEDRSDDAAPAPRARGTSRSDVARGDSGQLRLEVRPEDTSVYVDDDFRGTARELRVLTLAPGRHTIELVRPGYAIERREVEIVKDERADLLVELRRP
jgi:hypothetical protein